MLTKKQVGTLVFCLLANTAAQAVFLPMPGSERKPWRPRGIPECHESEKKWHDLPEKKKRQAPHKGGVIIEDEDGNKCWIPPYAKR